MDRRHNDYQAKRSNVFHRLGRHDRDQEVQHSGDRDLGPQRGYPPYSRENGNGNSGFRRPSYHHNDSPKRRGDAKSDRPQRGYNQRTSDSRPQHGRQNVKPPRQERDGHTSDRESAPVKREPSPSAASNEKYNDTTQKDETVHRESVSSAEGDSGSAVSKEGKSSSRRSLGTLLETHDDDTPLDYGDSDEDLEASRPNADTTQNNHQTDTTIKSTSARSLPDSEPANEDVREERGRIHSRELDTPLPRPWRAILSSKGEQYYYNEETGDSVWDLPEKIPISTPTHPQTAVETAPSSNRNHSRSPSVHQLAPVKRAYPDNDHRKSPSYTSASSSRQGYHAANSSSSSSSPPPFKRVYDNHRSHHDNSRRDHIVQRPLAPSFAANEHRTTWKNGTPPYDLADRGSRNRHDQGRHRSYR